jgi:hypothetical protein
MTKEEIIAKTLAEVHCGPDYREVIVEEMHKRLPDEVFKSCDDFARLSLECCEGCHAHYPHYDMYLIELLPEHSLAWVCCPILQAIGPGSSLVIEPKFDASFDDYE